MRLGAALVVAVALAGCGNVIVDEPAPDAGILDAGVFDAAACHVDMSSTYCLDCTESIGGFCCIPACVIGGCDPKLNSSCSGPIACVDPTVCPYY